ncbi:acyltransferase [Methanobacterium sp.]|uniref:acyltransferase n=1 Tax=Methanobacterium sp. TaxID=2164 RepID=UPI003158B555
MVRHKIVHFIRNNPDSYPSKTFRFMYNLLNGLNLLLSTLTGYIPFHTIRNILYRNIFRIKLPKDSIIYWRCRFFRPSGIKIGHNSIIGNDSFLDGRKNIYIGNNVNIAGNAHVYTMEHDINSPSFASVGSPVYICDWVYIGSRVTILPGVTINEGAVIASGSVVTKNIEKWTLAGGVPAKFIKERPVVKYKLNTKNKAFFQ